jgi:hypothetical protein
MPGLLDQRCRNHAAREAVARCPECALFYCRECVTEHEDRVLCAVCLKRIVGLNAANHRRWGIVTTLGQAFIGLIVAWFFFYLVGQGLLKIPETFHEGTMWNAPEAEGR